MSIMSGCDYLDSLPGIGTQTFLFNDINLSTLILLNCLGLGKAKKVLTNVKKNDIEQVRKKTF
jgi:hypothetical protein